MCIGVVALVHWHLRHQLRLQCHAMQLSKSMVKQVDDVLTVDM